MEIADSLKVVFLGTPDFAVASLDAIHNSSHQVVGVVTMPDKPMGRGHKLAGSPVKKYAEEHQIPCLQPEKLKNPEFLAQLEGFEADIFVVVAFRMLPLEVWNMPKMGTLNVHGSLLPQYRGAAPINWAIINGEEESGITVFRLKHKIDTGDILLKKKVAISPTESAGGLHDKLMVLGAQGIVEALDLMADGFTDFLPQDNEIKLKSAPKIYKDTAQINWEMEGEHLRNLIRGMDPYPGAWALIFTDNKEVQFKIFKSEFEPTQNSHTKEIDTDGKTYLKMGCLNGWLVIKEIQLAGKKRLPIADALRGYDFSKVKLV